MKEVIVKKIKKGKAGYKKIYSAITYNIKNKKKSKKNLIDWLSSCNDFDKLQVLV